VALALTVALVGGCGSTVPLSRRALSSAAGELGVGGGPSDTSAVGQDAGGLAPGSTSAGASLAAGVGATTGGTVAAAKSSVAAVRPNGPGVGPKTINVGFPYATNSAAAQAALGNTAVQSGDVKGEVDAVIRDVNTHGGVKGRQLVPIYHPVDATSTQTQDQVAEAGCADLAQDHKVLVSLAPNNANFLACMAKAGSVTVGANLGNASDTDYANNPTYYDVQALSLSAAARNLIAELHRDGYFTTGWNTATGAAGAAPVKVGIIVPDQPAWDDTMSKVVMPGLRAIGVHVDPQDVQRWHFPSSSSENAAAVSQINGAILRFRTDNVTHVLPMDVNSIGFFAAPAEAQRFRPRYGLSTVTTTEAYAGNLIPYVQLNGAIGLGWSPAVDLPQAASGAPAYVGPGRAHCLSVMQAAGFSFTSISTQAVALVACDFVYSIRDAVNAIPAGQPIDAVSYMKAVEGFGDRFQIAALPRARFAPGKHYAVDTGWRWVFDAACKCMAYVGAPFKLS
jgi:hypothetical protein